MQLIIASRNLNKIREFRAMLKLYSSLDVLSLLDFPSYEPLPEMGKTLEENSIQKAVHAAHTLNHWTLADDTGLVIPALQGSPGVYSARYAGNNATEADNRKKLLEAMKDVPESDRQAYFECILAIASPQGLKKTAQGVSIGTIPYEEQGNKGFGYDSVFIKDGYGKSFAQMDDDIKYRISHRRKALDKLILLLPSLIGQHNLVSPPI